MQAYVNQQLQSQTQQAFAAAQASNYAQPSVQQVQWQQPQQVQWQQHQQVQWQQPQQVQWDSASSPSYSGGDQVNNDGSDRQARTATASRSPSPSSNGAAAGGSSVSDPELRMALDLHNSIRARHGVGALAWDGGLQGDAQRWADGCVFQHSGSGENLAMGYSAFDAVMRAWYDDEIGQYSYSAGQYSAATGHATQIVWKGSQRLGCGYAPRCSMYVCHYAPPGNVIGSFRDNVLPPGGSS